MTLIVKEDEKILDKINKIIDLKVRPVLAKHYGDIKVVNIKDDIVEVKLLGKCSGCLGAKYTIEDVVETAIKEEISSIKAVVLHNEVSEELWEIAKKFLNNKKQIN